MNREMSNNFMEMGGSHSGQGLPEWFKHMMSRRSSSSHGMMPFGNQSMMTSFRMDDQGMNRFMRPERGMRPLQGNHNYYSHQRNEGSMGRYESFGDQHSHGYFPFYRFGNWGGNTSRSMRIQTSFPIRGTNGDYFNMGASFSNGNNYHFLKYPGSLDMNNYQVIGTIPSRFPNHIGYFHAYGMTDNYFVFCEQPIGFNVRQFANNQRVSGDYGMEYIQGESNYFYIMDRRTGRCREMSYVTDESYFFYNFVNCYEHENHLVIDVKGFEGSGFNSSMRYPSTQFLREKYNSSKIMRFRLPLGSSYSSGMEWNHSSFWRQEGNRMMLRPQYLFSESECMYPCINPNYSSRKYQYTYGQSGNSMIKFDAENGRTLTWRGGENELMRPYRTMFVPNPSGMYEDDGVLVSWCSHSRDDCSKNYMVFINAHNMEELSRFHSDSPLPFGSSFDSFCSPNFMQW